MEEAVKQFLVELKECQERGYGTVELVGSQPLCIGGIAVEDEYLPNLGYDVVEVQCNA